MALGDGEGHYSTVGVLGAGDGHIDFKALPEFPEIEVTFQRELVVAVAGGMKPVDIFDYYVERANGITREFSVPFDMDGPDLEFALDRVIGRRAARPAP
jgi:hypothetical protein